LHRRRKETARRVADQRHDWLHDVSATLARPFAPVVIVLRTRNSPGSAAVPANEPGLNVAHKRGFEREILDAV